eukprot:58778-Chlamydomonas_euryale.AAC.1
MPSPSSHPFSSHHIRVACTPHVHDHKDAQERGHLLAKRRAHQLRVALGAVAVAAAAARGGSGRDGGRRSGG